MRVWSRWLDDNAIVVKVQAGFSDTRYIALNRSPTLFSHASWYSIRAGRSHKRYLERIRKAREEAIRRNDEGRGVVK